MARIRIYGLVTAGGGTIELTSWTSYAYKTASAFIAGFGNIPIIAFDENAPEICPSNSSERALEVRKAFMRGDHWGDRDTAIRMYNEWALVYSQATYINQITPVTVAPIGPRKPIPKLPAEVHASKAFDADIAWKAVQDLSKGS